MVKIYNYTGSFPTMGNTRNRAPSSERYMVNRFSLFTVMDLYTNEFSNDIYNPNAEWKVNATTTHTNKRECMVFYSWDSMRFFAMNRFHATIAGDADSRNNPNRRGYNTLFFTRGYYIHIQNVVSEGKVGTLVGASTLDMFTDDIINATDVNDMLKNRKQAFDNYNKDEYRTQVTDHYLNELNKFLVDVAEKLNNFETMTRAFNSSNVNMVLSPSAMEPFKWAELPSTNYSNPGTLGFSENKMTGGDISAEVLSLVHLLEYRNAVNNNFVNNVLPTLKGGAARQDIAVAPDVKVVRNVNLRALAEPENIERELVNYITNTQTDLTLYNRLTEFAKDPNTEVEMRSYLNRLARDVAKAEGIRRLIEADRSLLGENTWDAIRKKVGKYGTRAATVGNKLKQAIHIILGANSVTVT